MTLLDLDLSLPHLMVENILALADTFSTNVFFPSTNEGSPFLQTKPKEIKLVRKEETLLLNVKNRLHIFNVTLKLLYQLNNSLHL